MRYMGGIVETGLWGCSFGGVTHWCFPGAIVMSYGCGEEETVGFFQNQELICMYIVYFAPFSNSNSVNNLLLT